MKQLLKKYWWGVLMLLLLPLILNWAVTRDSIFDCKIAGEPKDWLSLWIIYFSALMSLAMVVITLYTLKQNKEQLEEIKKEREEAQRARLVFDIIIFRMGYFLRIRNIGKENAFNVSIHVNKDFIRNIDGKNRIIFTKIEDPFYVPTDIPKYFYIGACSDVKIRWVGKDIPLSLNGKYCDKHKIQEKLDMNQFIGKLEFIVEDELTATFKDFNETIIEKKVICNTIQRSLDIIAKNIGR